METLIVFAIGFAGCYIAIAAHITLSSLYASLLSYNLIARARVFISVVFLLTAIANFVQYLSLGQKGCVFAAKFSIITFHIQMFSGEAFQMYRITVITGRSRVFIGLGGALLLMRAAVSISDVVLSTSTSNDDGVCGFVQELYSGVFHVAIDAVVELFITTALTVALFRHAKELKRLHTGSTYITLYKVIVETNVFRTAILFLINMFTLLVIMIDPNSVILTYMWSAMGIMYLYFVIYDKGMVRFLHQLAKSPDDSEPLPSNETCTNLSDSLSRPPFMMMSSNPHRPMTSIPSSYFPESVDEWVGQYYPHLSGLGNSVYPSHTLSNPMARP